MTSGKENKIYLWDCRMLVSRPFVSSLPACSPVLTMADHEFDGYNIQTEFLNNDAHIITGSSSNRVVLSHQIYIYSARSGKLEEVFSSVSSSMVPSVVPLPRKGPFAFAYCPFQSSRVYTVLPTDRAFNIPFEPITDAEVRRDRLMSLLAKNWKLLLKITQEYDLSGTGDSWRLLLEVLLLNEETEIKEFARRLMAIISDNRPVPQSEIDYRVNQRQKRLKVLQNKLCLPCQEKRINPFGVPRDLLKATHGAEFEVRPKSSLGALLESCTGNKQASPATKINFSLQNLL